MISTVPVFIAWPLLVCMAIVLVLRYALCHASLVQTYVNHALAFCLGFNLLREAVVVNFLADHHILSATAAAALSGVAVNVAFVEFLGFTTLWSGASPQKARRRHWYRRLVAAILLVPVFFIAVSHARPGDALGYEIRGSTIYLVAGLLQMALPVYLVGRTLRLGLREWARRDVSRRDRMIAAYLVTAFLVIFIACLGGAVSMFFFHGQFPTALTGFIYLGLSMAFFVPSAIPVVGACLAYVGLDGTSRSWYALRELREDLAVAVRESVFDTVVASRRRRKTALELHRSVVQIRDGILFLRPYFREITDEEAARLLPSDAKWRPGEREAAILALQIADAIRAKEAGNSPATISAMIRSDSSPASLAEEAAELVRVSKWWPNARIAVQAEAGSMAPSAPPRSA